MSFIFVAIVVACTILLFRALLGRAARFFPRAPVFEMTFDEGQLRSLSGPVPARIRADLLEVAQDGGVTGTLQYFAPGEYSFSDGVSEGTEQRFRNVLALTFPAPATTGSGPRHRSG